ncbi:UDP-glucoronosyl and UDP-glucosyl transferase [Chloropicon roscoffensis]|uniref:UDP-glucoronosyl and UDP-glucosyl transferase n=1 Tax=Chloropicon roscoffensis TaxID=1461544 RepID=A0AAX4PHM8_9CHLO|mmetsp:Transcript_383/g.1186  ORF Transcript_383/g.1186 Transcript_383/m.1186 type:complete len:475 (-) Transcript_383:49-1473(-)
MPVERIAVVPFDAVGHMNPQIALVSSFLTRGAKLRFYLATPQFKSTIEDLGKGGESISSLVLSDTEDVHLLTSPPAADGSDDNISGLTIGICSHTLQTLPKMLEDLRAFKPDVIVYDPFAIAGAIAARMLDVPAVCTVTVPNVGSIPIFAGCSCDGDKRKKLEEVRASKSLIDLGRRFEELLGFDPLETMLVMSAYLPNGLQLCTGVKSFEQKIPDFVTKEVFRGDLKSCYVGPMLSTQHRVTLKKVESSKKQWIDLDFPHQQLSAWKREGKKIVYMSMGTVCTSSFFWDYDGPLSKVYGAKGNGKVHCQTLWKRMVDAFGGSAEYAIVVATCTQDLDALAGTGLEDPPANFIVRRRCPQLEILEVADVFVTHAGANSMLESIAATVPMLVLPYFSDQLDNAPMVTRLGMGKHHGDPVKEATAEVLAADVEELLRRRPEIIEAMMRVQQEIARAGGVPAAVEAVEKYVEGFRGH